MRILLTGATGLIGSRFEELMYETHEIIPLSSTHGVDITNPASLSDFLLGKGIDVVIHLAAKTDVDACEVDRADDLSHLAIDPLDLISLDAINLPSDQWIDKKTAFSINTVGTKNIYEAAKGMGAKFIYISTDFVFSGKEEYISETSSPAPIDWYGWTKYFGEKIINPVTDLIVRLSFPYGYRSPIKSDFVWKLHDLLKDREEVALVSDQIITPTFIDDIIYGLDFLITNKATGIYHLTGSGSLTPREIGEKIQEKFGFRTVIKSTDLATLYKDKAPRPYRSRMQNEKLTILGYKTKSFDEGLALIS